MYNRAIKTNHLQIVRHKRISTAVRFRISDEPRQAKQRIAQNPVENKQILKLETKTRRGIRPREGWGGRPTNQPDLGFRGGAKKVHGVQKARRKSVACLLRSASSRPPGAAWLTLADGAVGERGRDEITRREDGLIYSRVAGLGLDGSTGQFRNQNFWLDPEAV